MAERNRTPKSTPVRNASSKSSEADTREGSQSRTLDKGTEDIRNRLAEHVGSLRFVNSAMVVCIQALQQQNAEMDADIAHVLQRTAGDKLDETTDRLEELALGLEFRE